MAYEIIIDWTARRSGARITVYGKTTNGEFRRLPNVDQITVEMGDAGRDMRRVVATDADGVKYRLAL